MYTDLVISNPGYYVERLADNEARIKDTKTRMEGLKIGEQTKIKNLKDDLNQYDKNPHFYRNRKILAVAGTIALVAAVVIASYFTLGFALPFFIGINVGGGLYSLASFVGVFGSIFTFSPLAGLIAIPPIHKRVWSTPEKDRILLTQKEQDHKEALDKLRISEKQIEEDDKQLKAALKKEITSKQHSLQLHQEATVDSFSEAAWNATITLSPSLKLLITPEKQKAAWLNKQVTLLETRENLPQNIQDLERQLEKFVKIED